MANKEQVLKTKIRLRYDSFDHWSKCTEPLLEGEIAVAYLGESVSKDEYLKTHPSHANTHPVMFKVGPGKFNDLPWASALAADVYGWAKKAQGAAEDIKVLETKNTSLKDKTVTEALESLASEISALIGNDENGGSISDLITAAINKLDYTDKAVDGQYVSAVSEVDGVISVERKALPTYTLSTGAANGTVKLNDTEVAVAGLGSAAFTESTAYATSAQGTAADSAMQGATILGKPLNKDTNTLSVDEAKAALGLGSAAYTESTTYATSQQGGKADSAIQGVKVSGTDLAKDNDNKVDITDSIKTVAAAEINTLIGGVSNADTIENINTLITYVNENGANTTAILTELYGESADTTKDSRIDALEKKSGLDKVGTVTKVSAGNGLTGGDITESGTIALNDEYVKTIKVNAAGAADSAINAENAVKATNADSAADSNKLNGQTADFYLTKNETTGWDDILTKTEASTTYQPVGNYATSDQGTKADNALQAIEAGTGLKVSEKANNKQTISIDEEVVFVLWGGDAEGWTVNHDGNS